jgi:hypothetical protein
VAVFIILFVLSFVVAGVHIYRYKEPRTGGRVAEILLLWLLVINTGFGGLYAFSGHVFAADEVAASIGWPAGNPFQTEVGVANLAIGTSGILSYWIRGNFWTAAVIATCIWLLGAAAIHVREMVGEGNYTIPEMRVSCFAWTSLVLFFSSLCSSTPGARSEQGRG